MSQLVGKPDISFMFHGRAHLCIHMLSLSVLILYVECINSVLTYLMAEIFQLSRKDVFIMLELNLL